MTKKCVVTVIFKCNWPMKLGILIGRFCIHVNSIQFKNSFVNYPKEKHSWPTSSHSEAHCLTMADLQHAAM